MRMDIHVEVYPVGSLRTNCYIISDPTALIVIDPGAEFEHLRGGLAGRKVDAILITHGHGDHIGALRDLVDLTGAPVYIGRPDAPGLLEGKLNRSWAVEDATWVDRVDHELDDGDTITCGDMAFTVIATPGHTPGGVCYYCPEAKLLFSGDTLFAGCVGRTDFAGGDDAAMRASIARLRELPDDVMVYPGHEAATQIGREKRINPFM